MPRVIALIAAASLGSGCLFFHDVSVHETVWEPATFFEVDRAKALELRSQEIDGTTWLKVVEVTRCTEEATQRGVEIEERKPKGWVLGVGGALGATGTAAAIGILGGALTNGMTQDARNGQQSGAAQIVGVGIGVVGSVAQLLLFKQIAKGLGEIRYTREKPVSQEVGQRRICEEKPMTGVLQGKGFPPEGLKLETSFRAPPDFTPAGLTLDGVPVVLPPQD